MSLHLCLDCAVIYDVPESVPRICPRCEKPLTLRQDNEFSDSPSWLLIASRAIHGEAPRIRRRWSVE